METSINGKPAMWTAGIWALWHMVADDADPKLTDDQVLRANYFTPRPYVDEYNTGSREEGFVYAVGRRVMQAIVHTHATVGGDR